MTVLVCGGAGYIGSHMVRLLQAQGEEVVVFDNLSTGHACALPGGVELVNGDLLDSGALASVFERFNFDAVVHFAAYSQVGESMSAPYKYYSNNVVGTLNLLDAMRSASVKRIVFSSTAAVYGNPLHSPIDEGHPTAPINPYGASKLMVERILADGAVAYGLRSVSLRYFNAAGAETSGCIGESHEPETHLIPNILKAALGNGARLKIFGQDYPTPDGTCVRDYVHVLDLGVAHLQALSFLQSHSGAHVFNLGNGSGFSVKEVLDAALRVTGRSIPFDAAPRRAGDPPMLVASSDRARAELGWEPQHSALDGIIADAWRWHQRASY
ncbi:UDP-glucose 4-epimerase [Xanthomonas sacchari]|uniref:UDP-glucose 4-epimerase GalE n=1 Tax=Xanthomonas sacchari TaxID=56458 RepID=UPI002251A2D4|nr:UDP-glucose 4-epimerase GalE [Xanthomonas sacchari]MCW0386582.1 UDP-glucose 4-epimerase [Xanthomonas sacchari]